METKSSLESKKNSIKDDLLLFEEIAQGKYAALEKLFDKYYDPLCRFGLTYQKEMTIVEEKISDVFILIWNKRSELHNVKKPKSYIYVIAKNRLKKSLKNLSLEKSMEGKSHTSILFTPSKEEEIIDREQKESDKRFIESLLAKVPEKSRQIFELSRIDGFRYKEISEILELSPRTVENHIATTMKIIHKGIQESRHNKQ